MPLIPIVFGFIGRRVLATALASLVMSVGLAVARNWDIKSEPIPPSGEPKAKDTPLQQ